MECTFIPGFGDFEGAVEQRFDFRQARKSSGARGSGRSRDQYVAYSAPWAARMPGSVSLSRLAGSSASSSWSDPMPMARWIAAIGTSCPAWANASHQVTACR